MPTDKRDNTDTHADESISDCASSNSMDSLAGVISMSKKLVVENNYNEALQILSKASERWNYSLPLEGLKAVCCKEVGDSVSAIECYERILGFTPDPPHWVHVGYANVLDHSNNRKKAIQQMVSAVNKRYSLDVAERIVRMVRTEVDTTEAISVLVNACIHANGGRKEFDEVFELAELLVKEGEIDGGITLYTAVLGCEGRTSNLVERAVKNLIAAGELERAIYLVDCWKDHNPENTELDVLYSSFKKATKISRTDEYFALTKNPEPIDDEGQDVVYYHFLRYGLTTWDQSENDPAWDQRKNVFHQYLLWKSYVLREFDANYYLNKYEGTWCADVSPIDHYITNGWRMGCNPSPLFNVNEYFECNQDVAKRRIEPFFHYIRYGRNEGRQLASDSTLSSKNLLRSVDSLNEVEAALSGYFDPSFYERNYMDVAGNDLDPIRHYILYGYREGRNPCRWFCTSSYVGRYSSVIPEDVNPFYHYLCYGKARGFEIKGVRDEISPNKYRLSVDPSATLVVSDDITDMGKVYEIDNILSPSTSYDVGRLDVHWIIPDFHIGGGGHMTIFRMVRWLELFGHKCTIWIINPRNFSDEEQAYESILKNYQTILAEVKFIRRYSVPEIGDVAIATSWQTVNLVSMLKGFKEHFYFIQDFEPAFYGVGSHSLSAEETYRQGLSAICASPWLKALVEKRYDGWARSFMLAFDDSTYCETESSIRGESSTQYNIAVYSRIGTSRRAVELAFAGLELLALERTDFEVHLFGGSLDSAIRAPFKCVVHGILPPKELADLYNRCDLGVCFSATNYSLVPQEMMACGLPVVELDVESTRGIFPGGVVTFARPIPDEIMKSISEILDDEGLRMSQIEKAKKWVSQFSWEKSARDVEGAILERLNESWSASESTDESIKVSVVIPVYNGGELLKEVVESVLRQTAPWAYELLVIDSGSTDGSVEYIQKQDHIRLYHIPNEEFQHGATRNRAVELSNGEFVAFLTQDAIPSDEYWLYNLVVTLDHYPLGAGVFGRHMPHKGASYFSGMEIEDHFKTFDNLPLSLSKYSDYERYLKDASWKQVLHFYSDNNSCLRKSVWKEIPYRHVKYGEDQLWAHDVIEGGYSKIYAPTAMVYHSHEYKAEEIYNRSKIDGDYFRYYWGYTLVDPAEAGNLIDTMIDNDMKVGLALGLNEKELDDRAEGIRLRITGYLAGQNRIVSLFCEENTDKSKY